MHALYYVGSFSGNFQILSHSCGYKRKSVSTLRMKLTTLRQTMMWLGWLFCLELHCMKPYKVPADNTSDSLREGKRVQILLRWVASFQLRFVFSLGMRLA